MALTLSSVSGLLIGNCCCVVYFWEGFYQYIFLLVCIKCPWLKVVTGIFFLFTAIRQAISKALVAYYQKCEYSSTLFKS